jgi:protease I
VDEVGSNRWLIERADFPILEGGNLSKHKILIVTGDAGESLEVMYPYQRLQEEGYEVHIAAPTKKKLRFVVHDFEPDYDTFTEKPGYSWEADVAFADVDPAEYVALVIPGGRAPEYIRNHVDCRRIIQYFFQNNKPVAHICHAPLALAAAGVLAGRRVAGYPALEPDIQAAGAEFVNSDAVIDGTMVSARAWPDHPAWMREFIHLLRAKSPVKEREQAAA